MLKFLVGQDFPYGHVFDINHFTIFLYFTDSKTDAKLSSPAAT